MHTCDACTYDAKKVQRVQCHIFCVHTAYVLYSIVNIMDSASVTVIFAVVVKLIASFCKYMKQLATLHDRANCLVFF